MTIREAAERYGVPKGTLLMAVRRRDVPSRRVDSRGRYGWRYDVAAVDVRRWVKWTWRQRAA